MFMKFDVDFIYNVMALSFSSEVYNHTSIFCQACGTVLISLFYICGFLTEKLLQYQIFGDRKVMCRQHMLNVKQMQIKNIILNLRDDDEYENQKNWDLGLELGNLYIQMSGIAVCETTSMQIIEEGDHSY